MESSVIDAGSYLQYQVPNGVPVKAWVKGVEFEDAARKQVENLARMPFVHSHVAVLPDVHAGIGATVGSVIATSGAIIPAAVGVDIGCGMIAQRTTLSASDLPDDDHRSGNVRGLLCRFCNTLLGQAFDNIDILNSAVDYLKGSFNEVH